MRKYALLVGLAVMGLSQNVYGAEISDEAIDTIIYWKGRYVNDLTIINNYYLQVKQLAIQGLDSLPYDQRHREMMAKTTDALLDEIFSVANDTIGDLYLFSGSNVIDTPFTVVMNGGEIDTVIYNENTVLRKIGVGNGDSVVLNMSGSEVFSLAGDPQSLDVFEAVIIVRDGIRGGGLDSTDISYIDSIIASIDTMINRLNQEIDEYDKMRSGGFIIENFKNVNRNIDVPTVDSNTLFDVRGRSFTGWDKVRSTGILFSMEKGSRLVKKRLIIK